MSGSRSRVAVACVVLAMLLAGFSHGGELRGVLRLDGGAERSSASLSGAPPVGAVLPAVRLRTSLSSERLLETRWTGSTWTGVAWLAAAGVAAAALVWWWLSRRDRGAEVPLPRRSPAALRAPPAPSFV